jgi:hypothetical protein
MISSFGKPLPVQRTDRAWGELAGAIYRDFALSYPAWILSGPLDRRSEAKPVVKYTVKGKGLKRRLVTGETQFGDFVCDLVPTERAILGSPALLGELSTAGRSVGTASVGPTDSMKELGRIKAAKAEWSLSLSVSRQNPLIAEGDVSIADSEQGDIIRLQRRDYSWSEQVKSRLGFGRSKRGQFLDSAEQVLASTEKKLAALFLLVCYLQLLELPFNTDITSS